MTVPTPNGRSTRPFPRALIWIGVIVAVVVVSSVVLVASVLPRTPPAPSGTTLARSGTAYEIQAGQYQTIAFTLEASSIVSGAVSTTFNVTLYLLTPAGYLHLVTTGVVPASNWTSGIVTRGSFSFPAPAGSWDLVFVDPNSLQATSVVVTSDIIVTPAA